MHLGGEVLALGLACREALLQVRRLAPQHLPRTRTGGMPTGEGTCGGGWAAAYGVGWEEKTRGRLPKAKEASAQAHGVQPRQLFVRRACGAGMRGGNLVRAARTCFGDCVGQEPFRVRTVSEKEPEYRLHSDNTTVSALVGKWEPLADA